MSARRAARAAVLSVLLSVALSVLVSLAASGSVAAGSAPPVGADAARPAAGAPRPDADGPGYVPPVGAPVVDPFRPPASAFGPGNRGLTYDLDPGTEVRASAPGTVTFAGPVADTRHVTVLHDDGLRTSYSFLETVGVRRGRTVRRGDVVGTAGPGFHFGVRAGDTYLDPAALFGRVEVRVRLVPHDEPLPSRRAGVLRERRALAEVVRARGVTGRGGEAGARPTQGGHEAPAAGGGPRTAGRDVPADAPGGGDGRGGGGLPRPASTPGFPVVAAVRTLSRWPGHPSGSHADRSPAGSPHGRRLLRVAAPARRQQNRGATQGDSRGSRHDEATAGGRRPLRPPDPPVEPEDEALHLR